jgi:hypothetical protein
MRFVLTLIFTIVLANATIAYRGVITFKQPDGSTFQGYLKGDEFYSWIQTKAGYTAQYNNETKQYEYLTYENSELSFTAEAVRTVDGVEQASPSIHVIDQDHLINIWTKKRQEKK